MAGGGRPVGRRSRHPRRPRLRAAHRLVFPVHRHVGAAQFRAQAAFPGQSAPRRPMGGDNSGLRHPPACRAAVLDRRPHQSVLDPVSRAGDDIGGVAAVAAHSRALVAGLGLRHRSDVLASPVALGRGRRSASADALWRRHLGGDRRRRRVHHPLRQPRRRRGAAAGRRAQRHGTGARARAAPVAARWSGGGGGPRTRHAAGDRRAGRHRDDAPEPAARRLRR